MPKLSIRRKVAVALAAPLVMLIVLIGIQVKKAADVAAEVGEQTDTAKAAIGPSGIITALQDERSWTSVELIGQEEQLEVPVAGYEETRSRTDAAIEAFRGELDTRGGVFEAAYRPAIDQLDELTDLRAEVDASPEPRDLSNLAFQDDIFLRYSALVAPLFEGTTRVALEIDDPELRQGLELADAASRQVETLSLLITRTTSATVLTGGPDGLEIPEIREIASLQSAFRRHAATMTEATGPYAALADDLFPEPLNARINGHVDNAINTGQIDVGGFLEDVAVSEDESYTGYIRALHEMISERADDLRSDAEARQLRLGLLAGVLILITVGLTVQTSLSITRPLHSLTRQAQETAHGRLPEAVHGVLDTPLGDDVRVPHLAPVSVATHDEVADVAGALNTVQGSALHLAVEQAVLRRNIADSFLNLGRRNQNLLSRQLDFITELEANETDPDVLAGLFRLDHLATRMRRNAESLLVLAGVAPPRRWSAPVPVVDVVRAALGEVEDYQRVGITAVDTATVLGSVAADLTHVVAELLENALTFSPPQQGVEVRGRHRIESAGYVLTIVDAGLGMTPDELTQANRRLAGTESYTVAPSKYLGHYVAGRLASRHAIDLRLHPTPGRGITAAVVLPAEVVARPGDGRVGEARVGDGRVDARGPTSWAALASLPVARPSG